MLLLMTLFEAEYRREGERQQPNLPIVLRLESDMVHLQTCSYSAKGRGHDVVGSPALSGFVSAKPAACYLFLK